MPVRPQLPVVPAREPGHLPEERDDVEVLPVAPLFPEVPGVERGQFGQLWPHRHGTDAMFMALLRRTR